MSVVCGTSTGFDDTAAGSRPVSALSDSGRATPALVAASLLIQQGQSRDVPG